MHIPVYTDENVKQCIRMGIAVLKIDICGGKSSLLWPQTAFYSDMTIKLSIDLFCRKT